MATVPLNLDSIETRLAGNYLTVLGGFVCKDDDGLPAGTRTLILIGPGESGYWDHVRAQPEWVGPNPIDRWSRRVIGQLACDLGAKALFPFGGPPWHPFHRWALRSGQVWESPVRLLVHANQGLMVSFRGALALKEVVTLRAAPDDPCAPCSKPCLEACPVGALAGGGYDLPRCHGYLDSTAGADCMGQGCAVRRACPLSQRYARIAEHSAYHMRQFHK